MHILNEMQVKTRICNLDSSFYIPSHRTLAQTFKKYKYISHAHEINSRNPVALKYSHQSILSGYAVTHVLYYISMRLHQHQKSKINIFRPALYILTFGMFVFVSAY